MRDPFAPTGGLARVRDRRWQRWRRSVMRRLYAIAAMWAILMAICAAAAWYVSTRPVVLVFA